MDEGEGMADQSRAITDPLDLYPEIADMSDEELAYDIFWLKVIEVLCWAVAGISLAGFVVLGVASITTP